MKLSQTEASRPSLRSWLLCLAAAVGLWLGFPNDFISFPPLVLAWPVALTLLGREASSRAQALRLGWLATIAGGIAALYWLTLPVHNVGGLPWLLAIPCALFIVTCIGSVGGLFAVAAHVLRARPAWVQAVLLGYCGTYCKPCTPARWAFPGWTWLARFRPGRCWYRLPM